MRNAMALTIVLAVVPAAGCKKGEEGAGPPESAPAAKTQERLKAGSEPNTAKTAGTSVGVEAGGIQRSADEGPGAVVTTAKGTVEIRRLGETKFSPVTANGTVFAGDVIRTGDGGSAVVTLEDHSVIEIAEVSSVAIGSRAASADPASSAAVLSGLARFSVSGRSPGEGAFNVFTPAGVIVTRGTVYGVGVSASGSARVGVESGSVDVIGLAAMDAQPIAVGAGSHVVLEAKGTIGNPAPWPAPDWGEWRASADASGELVATLDAHAAAMADLDVQLAAAYADLSSSADGVASFEATAAASAGKNDTATYEAALPDGAASIDASFAVAGRIDALTWAYASHGALATDLYVRHPDVLTPRWQLIAPRVDASVLWPKRFEVTAVGYLEPVRMQYYVHHPRGRMHAPVVGVKVPAFYAAVTPPAIDDARVRARVKTKLWVAPEVRYTASTRPVWIASPSASWHAKVAVAPAPITGGASWYVRPAKLDTSVLLGAQVRGAWESRLAVGAPAPRASLRAAWSIPVGTKIAIAPPDLRAAATARASWKLDGGTAIAAPDMKADLRAKARVEVPAVKVKAPDLKAGIDAKVRDHRDLAVGAAGGVKGRVGGAIEASTGAGADVKAGIKVKAPEVKVKAPEVKVKGEAKGSFSIGGR